MGRNTDNNSTPSGKGGNQFVVGILIGVVAGVSLAAGMAWFMKNTPSPFMKTEPVTIISPSLDAVRTPSAAASGVGDGKPRFEFYKVLTDKQDPTVRTPAKPVEKSKPTDSKPAPLYEVQILQAGSFSNEADAEKLKAKLALLGLEAGVQVATIPDKGVWYRVRLGPYKTADSINHARNFLKQNGVESTPMRAQ